MKLSAAQTTALSVLPVTVTLWGDKPFGGPPKGVHSMNTLAALRTRGLVAASADGLSVTIPGIHSVGGQQAGIQSGVRATHIPSGVMAYVDIGRSQHINKMIADDMIRAPQRPWVQAMGAATEDAS